jgi:hypothetical protein
MTTIFNNDFMFCYVNFMSFIHGDEGQYVCVFVKLVALNTAYVLDSFAFVYDGSHRGMPEK